MRTLALLLATAAAVLSMGASAGPPKSLVDYVRVMINDGYDPNDPEGPPLREPPAKMFKRVDINGDGLTDWKIDFDGQMGWCGTGGCRMELWLGQPDGGLNPVWNVGVREFKLKPRKTGAVVDVDFHGSACGGFGAMECPRRYVWDEAEGAFVQAVNVKGDGFLAGLPIDALEQSYKDAPAEVRAQAQRLVAACAAAGGEMAPEEVGVGRVPDLNGDGRREWYVGSEYPECSADLTPGREPLRLIILVSTPDGGFAPAWETKDVFISFDIAKRPAVMIELEGDTEDCGAPSSASCPRRPLRWDEASRKLVPAT